jgi:hypothetical protein
MFDKNLVAGIVVLGLVVFLVYSYSPKLRAMLPGIEMFADAKDARLKSKLIKTPAENGKPAAISAAPMQGAIAAAAPAAAKPATEGFADYASFDESGMGPVPMAGAAKPQGCYPKQQLSAGELLPLDGNSQWAAMNPQGSGDLQGKNFLSAGALIGVNTIGQSMRNANLQLRAEPPNPQQQVSPWLQSTIEPDLQRRPLE